MRKIVDSFVVGKYTVLVLDSPPPREWRKNVRVENIEYESDIAYDIPNAICVIGTGDFDGKIVEFV